MQEILSPFLEKLEYVLYDLEQMKYKSTFPLLINLNNKPTYLVSLKDDAGLVKMYGFIDVKDYYKKDDIDYTNKLTNLVYSISEGSFNLTRKVVKKIFKKLGSMIDE